MFKDHLGSILRVTNAAGTTEADQSFDAWGRRRNPTTWAYTSATPPTQTWLYRGYTAHEHLDQFALINMNGRLYDPTVGRMLSPDNYVQDALYAQTFNRYSYAHNNPLKFTDPDGENPAIVVGAVLGGLINLGVGIWRGEVHDLMDGIVYFGTGAAIGALAGATGGASLAGTGLTAGSILGGAYAGAVGGAVGGMLQGAANATWQTIRYHAPTENIAKAGAQGLVAGAVGGAIIGGTVGGIKAALKGLPFSPKTAPKVTVTPAGTVTPKPLTMNEVSDLANGEIRTEGSFGGKIKPAPLLQPYNSVESLLDDARPTLRPLTRGGIGGYVQGGDTADDIFNGLAQQYGAEIQTAANGTSFFKVDGLRVGIHSGTSINGQGIRMIDIVSRTLGNFKIWTIP